MPRLDRTKAVHHVYRCYDETDRLVYVGSSANLFGRLTQHRRTSWWAPQVVRVTAKVYPNGVVAREHERKAIRTENPRWNKAGRWETRHTWDRAGWDDWMTMLIQRGDTFPFTMRQFADQYRAKWGADLDRAHLAAIVAAEEDHDRRRAEQEVRAAENRKRIAEIRRQDELGLRRERKEAHAKAKRLARKAKRAKAALAELDAVIELS